MNWLCRLFGCNDTECQEDLVECHDANIALNDALEEAERRVKELESVIPYPVPPKVDIVAQKDSYWVNSILLPMGIQRLPLDMTYYLCNQRDFLNIVAWSWVDTYEYRAEHFDCENFAFLFKAQADLHFTNQVGLVISYNAGHAFNMAIFPDGKVMILEPQNDEVWVYPKMPTPFYELKDAIVVI